MLQNAMHPLRDRILPMSVMLQTVTEEIGKLLLSHNPQLISIDSILHLFTCHMYITAIPKIITE